MKLPQSLKDSICWFLCAVAVMRYWNYKNKPISMLVHTSQKQDYHQAVATAISHWINTCDDEVLLEMCKSVYERECSRVTKEKWFEQNPKYGISAEQVRDYPEFSNFLSLKNCAILNSTKKETFSIAKGFILS